MWPTFAAIRVVTAASATLQRGTGQLDTVAVYGFVCLFFTGVFLIYQERSTAARVGLITCLFLNASYAILANVWPLACVMIMWAVATIRISVVRQRFVSKKSSDCSAGTHSKLCNEDSRINRMFGPTQN